MKNTLLDLNNHLFAQLERLSEEGITSGKLVIETKRSVAMIGIAKEIISNARLALDAQIALKDNFIERAPEMIGGRPPVPVVSATNGNAK